jgi:hypothetical protein
MDLGAFERSWMKNGVIAFILTRKNYDLQFFVKKNLLMLNRMLGTEFSRRLDGGKYYVLFLEQCTNLYSPF